MTAVNTGPLDSWAFSISTWQLTESIDPQVAPFKALTSSAPNTSDSCTAKHRMQAIQTGIIKMPDAYIINSEMHTIASKGLVGRSPYIAVACQILSDILSLNVLEFWRWLHSLCVTLHPCNCKAGSSSDVSSSSECCWGSGSCATLRVAIAPVKGERCTRGSVDAGDEPKAYFQIMNLSSNWNKICKRMQKEPWKRRWVTCVHRSFYQALVTGDPKACRFDIKQSKSQIYCSPLAWQLRAPQGTCIWPSASETDNQPNDRAG